MCGFGCSSWIPAAFGRLCVETGYARIPKQHLCPAAFGRLCVETASGHKNLRGEMPAAFGRLCVETNNPKPLNPHPPQPPSGGCVLKQIPVFAVFVRADPAAFGRLCVETFSCWIFSDFIFPAAFGRLCVETANWLTDKQIKTPSRLRAAVC